MITAYRGFVVTGILLLVYFLAQALCGGEVNPIEEYPEVSFNGTFVSEIPVLGCGKVSDNGRYWCTYEIGGVGDEVRELTNFQLFAEERLFSLPIAPGSDVMVSNSGVVVFFDHSKHFAQELTIHFYERTGQLLFSESFVGAFRFGFSPSGNKFGVGTPDGLYVITVPDHQVFQYDKGFQFAISEDDRWVVVASENVIRIYRDDKFVQEIQTGYQYTRKVCVSSELGLVAAIDKSWLKVFSLIDGTLLIENQLRGKQSFRDLMLYDGKIATGVHYRNREYSKGVIRVYSQSGKVILDREMATKEIPQPVRSKQSAPFDNRQDPIPWPFMPFDSMHTVWNYYEQHMGAGDFSYLHQGLDMIVPIEEPTYAVEAGIVKLVLTTGGSRYWRTAVSPEQSAGWSDGWLYAHLVEESIQVEVGDTVEVHDYLGDIVEWTEDWGHIHFVEIHDSGLVWLYEDNQWGINFNPLLALEPDSDWIAPVIDTVFWDSKFAFCTNETSDYLDADSLYGDIDIIVKVVDYVGLTGWQTPAFRTYYWVEDIDSGVTVFPGTLGQILNHRYDFYSAGHYEPFASVIYKHDEILEPSHWMDSTRSYHHILTNNNGDSLIDTTELDLAFATEDYPDGEYRIFVEVFDEYENSAVDSMDVRFRNHPFRVSDPGIPLPYEFHLAQNYPNPFNPSTRICYTIPSAGIVSLMVYDLQGRKVRTLVDGYREAGIYDLLFDGGRLASGIYFYQLSVRDFTEVRKMLLVR